MCFRKQYFSFFPGIVLYTGTFATHSNLSLGFELSPSNARSVYGSPTMRRTNISTRKKRVQILQTARTMRQSTFYAIVLKSKIPIYQRYIRLLLFYALSSPAPPGWKKGLEPSTFGTTIRRSNQLSYIHRVDTHSSYRDANVICFFGPCKIFGLKIFGKTHRVTKWQSPLLVCHAKPAKKRLAHLLMDTGVRKQLKKHI